MEVGYEGLDRNCNRKVSGFQFLVGYWFPKIGGPPSGEESYALRV